MIETSTSTGNIDGAILKVQTLAPVIRKNTDNPYFKSRFAEYPEIQAAIRPLLIEQGIITMFFPVIGNQLTMNVKHTGSKEFYKVTMDLKTIQDSPQAQGSAITYGKRYMLTAFFDLIIEDASDDDGNASSVSQPKKDAASTNATPAPLADLNWLNPNTKDWFTAKGMIFNKKKTIEDIRKQYKVNKANSELIVKKESLKPATAYWTFAVEYLAKKDAKSINITNMFDVTETDLTDLQIDATNYVAPAKPTETITPNINEAK